VVGLGLLVLAVNLPSRTQPASPLTIAPASVGSPWSGGAQPMTTTPAELGVVGPGTYRLALSEAAFATQRAVAFLMATPPQHNVVAGWFSPHHPTDAALLKVAAPPIAPASGPTTRAVLSPTSTEQRTTLTIHVDRQSVLSFFVTVGPNSTYAARSLTLTKISS
jgi:hypothetical protein